MINVDGYRLINDHYMQPDWERAKKQRKNLNNSDECKQDARMSGVDINRNYAYKFGINEDGSSGDFCDETYRGRHPFSEPESKAVKEFVESH